MSLTSYRAAPSRANLASPKGGDNVNGFSGTDQSTALMGTPYPLAMKPGDDLLFHRLGDSTIGAVRFHGRVRDGIGWVTDAMATKLHGERMGTHRSTTSMGPRNV